MINMMMRDVPERDRDYNEIIPVGEVLQVNKVNICPISHNRRAITLWKNHIRYIPLNILDFKPFARFHKDVAFSDKIIIFKDSVFPVQYGPDRHGDYQISIQSVSHQGLWFGRDVIEVITPDSTESTPMPEVTPNPTVKLSSINGDNSPTDGVVLFVEGGSAPTVVHTSQERWDEEAHRLARQCVGKTVYAFRLCGTYKVEDLPVKYTAVAPAAPPVQQIARINTDNFISTHNIKNGDIVQIVDRYNNNECNVKVLRTSKIIRLNNCWIDFNVS